MSNFRVLAILFDGDSGNTFYAGQVVTGHVQFHASKRIQIRGTCMFCFISCMTHDMF